MTKASGCRLPASGSGPASGVRLAAWRWRWWPPCRRRAPRPRAPRPPAALAPVAFQDVAKAAGIAVQHVNGASADKFLVETMGSGAVFFDYDADGWVDLFLVDGGSLADATVAARARHRLFRNLGTGTFADVTAASAITSREYGQGACAGDVDNDGRMDLYVTNYGPNQLYRNAGTARSSDVTRAAGVGLARLEHQLRVRSTWIATAIWTCSWPTTSTRRRTNNRFCGDPQRRIRVYCHPLNYKGLPSVLYRNDGKGVFTDISARAGIASARGQRPWRGRRRLRRRRLARRVRGQRRGAELPLSQRGQRPVHRGRPAAGVAVARDGKPAPAWAPSSPTTTATAGWIWSSRTTSSRRTACSATMAAACSPMQPWRAEWGRPRCRMSASAWRSSTSTTTARLDLAIVNGHVIDNTAVFRARIHPRAAQAAAAQHQRPALSGGRARSRGAGFAADGVGPIARCRPTWTTTATWTCW